MVQRKLIINKFVHVFAIKRNKVLSINKSAVSNKNRIEIRIEELGVQNKYFYARQQQQQ